ncbi:rhomboid family intramembrane serine protease [Urechidicola croceus]|uniref:Rhomboid family intramembrane serine protease n=1 Tax=Urechidicola croceus TaxID=1850246 RepID=A0A1D8PB31_9FLAO|nr:rhomboid family intramembrane serine protease [Urechidicola croceus]AOW21784.1 rhomboid family intramembrane serine protease [Urechidicola croceus]
MEDSKMFKFRRSVIIVPLVMVFTIWFVYWFEIQFGLNFNKYGIYPKTIKGLRGVLFSPFIHSNTSHLFNNSVPLAVLSGALLFFYDKIAFRVLIFGTIVTGLLTWILARSNYHIGASGVVYMLFSFIFFSGIIRKHYRLVALSLMVVFLYGGMIWYVFPIKERMSWEGHLSGFITGIILAFLYRKKGPQKSEYKFKQTDFDLLFDEEGNFIEILEEEVE